MDNNPINVTINCDCSIIPGRAKKADFGYRSIAGWTRRLADKAAEIAAMNDFTYNEETDLFVQMQWRSDKFDNMQNNGFCIEIENEKYFFGHDSSIEYVPLNFFKGHKEGEILPLTIKLKPMAVESKNERLRRYNEDEAPEFNITFNLKLNQLECDFSSMICIHSYYDKFEDELEYVESIHL